jgi:hypothetical protein
MEYCALTFCAFFAVLTLWIIGGEVLQEAPEEEAG